MTSHREVSCNKPWNKLRYQNPPESFVKILGFPQPTSGLIQKFRCGSYRFAFPPFALWSFLPPKRWSQMPLIRAVSATKLTPHLIERCRGSTFHRIIAAALSHESSNSLQPAGLIFTRPSVLRILWCRRLEDGHFLQGFSQTREPTPVFPKCGGGFHLWSTQLPRRSFLLVQSLISVQLCHQQITGNIRPSCPRTHLWGVCPVRASIEKPGMLCSTIFFTFWSAPSYDNDNQIAFEKHNF